MNCLLEKSLTEKATPFLLDFVVWLLNKSKKDNIKKLYFLSRDGQILYEIARSLAEHIETPELRYLYGSRQAFYLPTLEYLSPNEKLEWLTNKAFSQTIVDICQRLTIDYNSINHILADYNLKKTDPKKQLKRSELENFRKLLLDTRMERLINEKSRHSRSLVVKYFEQEGLFIENNWAIVDAGWSLRSQYSIQTILNSAGYKYKIAGYYIGVIKNHVPSDLAGYYSAFVTEDNGLVYGNPQHKWLFKQCNMILLEDVFMPATHGGVLGYTEDRSKITPSLETESDHQVRNNRIIQRKILSSAVTLYKNNDLSENNASKNFNTLGNFFTHPTKDDALSLAEITVNIEQTHNPKHYIKVASPLSIFEFFLVAIHDVTKIKYTRKSIWLNGSIAISPRHINLLYKSLIYIKELLNIK